MAKGKTKKCSIVMFRRRRMRVCRDRKGRITSMKRAGSRR